MMKETGDWVDGTPFTDAFGRFLKSLFPNMEQHDRYVEISRGYEKDGRSAITITLEEASSMKLFCDAHFLNFVVPKQRVAIEARMAAIGILPGQSGVVKVE